MIWLEGVLTWGEVSGRFVRWEPVEKDAGEQMREGAGEKQKKLSHTENAEDAEKDLGRIYPVPSTGATGRTG